MTYWIYNMGMPVPVSPQRLLDKRVVQPLAKLSKTDAIEGSDQENHKTVTLTSHTVNEAYDQHPGQDQHHQVSYAEQIMSTNIVTLPAEMRLIDAWQLFLKHRYRHFPVLDSSKKLIGIISDRDMLLQLSIGKKNNTVGQSMKSPVLSADSNTAIRELCEVMFNQHIGALPITDDQGQLQGIVTRSDILQSMIEHGPVQLWV